MSISEGAFAYLRLSFQPAYDPFNKNESLVNIMMLLKEIVPGLEYQIKEDGVYID